MRYSNIEETALYLSGVTKPANCLRYDAIFYILPFFIFHLLSSQILSIIILKVGPFLSVVRSFTERGIISWLKNSYNLGFDPLSMKGWGGINLLSLCMYVSAIGIYTPVFMIWTSAQIIYISLLFLQHEDFFLLYRKMSTGRQHNLHGQNVSDEVHATVLWPSPL